MSDRKYRQRGYQDQPREPRREERPAEKKEYAPRGQPPIAPKTFNMPGFREVVRCARCGNELTVAVAWTPGRHLHPMRRGAALMCPVRELRHRRTVRVSEAYPSSHFAEGRAQRLSVVRTEDYG